MNFQESTNYLLSLGNEVSAMKLGLENIRKLLAALGDPQKHYLKVQVAGTNGKGSVCAFLNSISLRAGIKTGMFTSPHLVSITERVQINGTDIGEDDFAGFATIVRDISQKLVAAGEVDNIPTFFEQVTAIALIAFEEAKVELAILETGLGGRLDATTAANAEIAAISRIDIDHQQYLGDTIEEIAAEKAAIIHEGSEVVVGEQEPAAMEVILERCRQVGVEPSLTGGNPTGRKGVGVGVNETPSLPVGFLPLGLAGRHQIENAMIAMALAEILIDNFKITEADILRGLQTASHPGRLERVGKFLFDGAHNIGGARALRDYLDEFVDQPITMIFGSMQDKDVKEIAAMLFPIAEKLILTRPNSTRAMSAALLPVRLFRGNAVLTDNVEAAIAKACEVTSRDGVIVVTGSLYLVGEVRDILTRLKFEI